MANTYKNIVITPNTGSSTGDPTIVFSGGSASVNTDIYLRTYTDSNGTLSFEGSAGQLFSITNDLAGSIFAVNDVSGISLIDVNVTSQQITLGPNYGNVGIGTSNAIYKLDVVGSANITSPTLLVAGQNVLASIIAGNTYAGAMSNSGNAYAATVGTSANTYAAGVGTSANAWASATFGTITNTAAAFSSANTAGTNANQAGVIANAAFGAANQAGTVANGKVATVTSNSTARIWANTVTVTDTETVYLDLATSGVTATTYGGSTNIPTFVVDAYGRITSAANVAISVGSMDYAYVNTSTTAANNYAGVMANSANGVASTTYAPKASPTFTGTVNMSANIANQVLTDGATINWNASLGQIATVTLTAAGRTMAAPTNLKVGTYILHVIQDGTGSKTITTWNAVFKWPGGVAPTLTTAANARDVFSFVCDGTNLYGSFLPDVK